MQTFPRAANTVARATLALAAFLAVGVPTAVAVLQRSSYATGVGACGSPPGETIVPYVRQPEQVVPGKPLFFATAMTLGGAATGLLVESHLGRPTKVEGNPDHPTSRGATDLFSQASVLT